MKKSMTERSIIKKAVIGLLIILEIICLTSCASQGVKYAEETFLIDIGFEGGSKKACILSPVEVTDKDGKLTARFVWSSENYDYMIVNGIRYDNENNGGPSTFTVAVDNITEPLKVIGDTVAMSTPHEIEYVITWGEKRAFDRSNEKDLKADKNRKTDTDRPCASVVSGKTFSDQQSADPCQSIRHR